MTINKNKFILFCLFFTFLFLIFLKNQVLCFAFFQNCTPQPFGGDLGRYQDNHYNNSIEGSIHGFTLSLIFYLTSKFIEFKDFITLYRLVFYAVIFLSGLKLLKDNSFLKFYLFLLVVFFYPFYDGYSSIGLKQGLGMIFMISSIFLVKKIYSIKSWSLIIASILSHYSLFLFYIIFYISKFFSMRFLIYLFLFSILGYISELNGFLFHLVVEIFEPMHQSLYTKTWLRFSDKIQFSYVIFSSIPLLFLSITKFKNFIVNDYVFNNLYKFHFLYCAIIFLFFSEFYYINRFLALSWILYPFYLLIFLNILNLRKKLF